MAHLSLFELNNLIKKSLENSLEPSYWVVGEISSFQVNQKGHCYMELVEKQNNFIQAKIRANVWSYTYRTISSQFETATGIQLKTGIKALFNVQVNFHEVYGLSLTVNNVDPNFTIGERKRKREETISRVLEEGLDKLNKALPLPIVPQRVAIISSETAAGYGDFLDQLSNNSRGLDFKTKLFPAMMQGDEAANSIINAINKIESESDNFDLIVIVRGGGAQTDLDAFDTYELAKCIAQTTIPALTGIGHDRDQTVADIVAHTPLKTPTAVAEFLISGAERVDDLLNEHIYRIENVLNSRLNLERQHLDYLALSLSNKAQNSINSQQNNLSNHSSQLSYKVRHLLDRQHSHILDLEHRIDLLNPKTILNRGYSLTLKDGKSIEDSSINPGDSIETLTKTHRLKSTVTEVENE